MKKNRNNIIKLGSSDTVNKDEKESQQKNPDQTPKKKTEYEGERLLIENEPTPVVGMDPMPSISKNIEDNIKFLDSIFKDDDLMTKRRFKTDNSSPIECAAYFIDGLSNDDSISLTFMKPIMESDESSEGDIEYKIKQKILYGSDFKMEEDMKSVISALLAGSSVFFFDNLEKALIGDTKGYKTRSISEPDNEKVLRGPREGFTEDILTNLSLIRRRFTTTDFKVKFFTVGVRTNTKISICYLDNVVDKKALEILYERLAKVDIDGVLDANYLEEFISDSPWSTFKTIGSTERPDTVAGKLLEGRIAIVVNGSPMVITTPYLFIENFQSGDDYYLNFFYSSVMRILRVFSFFLTICLPALFVALLTFHPQMLPTDLVMSIIAAREGVPIPVVIECVTLLFVFEIIRETGIRVPASIGQPLSIVGALVLGDAAISAKYVSSPMVIIVAMACLAGLMVQNLKSSIIVYRLLFLITSSIFGIYGFLFMFLFMIFHMLSLNSFSVPYASFSLLNKFRYQKDMIIRAPWWKMKDRPLSKNQKRMQPK